MDVKTERNTLYSNLEKDMKDDNPMSSLMLIDFMATELCNRTCVFCPRSKNYPNLNLHMDLNLVNKIAKNLSEFNYSGRLLFCGFGESLLYPNLSDAIKILRDELPHNNNIHLVTNGDRLNETVIIKLLDHGLNRFYISLYDGPEQVDYFNNLFARLNLNESYYFLQHYYLPAEQNYGFIKLSNRAGTLFEDEAYQGVCNIPFYAMSVNYDGKVLLCSHDWTKSQVLGNLNHQTIQDVWLKSEVLLDFRKSLGQGKRSHFPCSKCNIPGNLYGNKSREVLWRTHKY